MRMHWGLCVLLVEEDLNGGGGIQDEQSEYLSPSRVQRIECFISSQNEIRYQYRGTSPPPKHNEGFMYLRRDLNQGGAKLVFKETKRPNRRVGSMKKGVMTTILN